MSTVTEQLETLADAEAVEELETRLSEIEDRTEDAKSLAEIDGAEPDEADEKNYEEWGPNAPGQPAFTSH